MKRQRSVLIGGLVYLVVGVASASIFGLLVADGGLANTLKLQIAWWLLTTSVLCLAVSAVILGQSAYTPGQRVLARAIAASVVVADVAFAVTTFLIGAASASVRSGPNMLLLLAVFHLYLGVVVIRGFAGSRGQVEQPRI